MGLIRSYDNEEIHAANMAAQPVIAEDDSRIAAIVNLAGYLDLPICQRDVELLRTTAIGYVQILERLCPGYDLMAPDQVLASDHGTDIREILSNTYVPLSGY